MRVSIDHSEVKTGLVLKKMLTEYTCRNLSEAKEYEAELIAQLKRLKDFLGDNGQQAENKTFEL